MDWFDDFDDCGEKDFMDEDLFEDNFEGEMDEPFIDGPDHEEEPDKAESQDDKFTAKDAFLVGAFAAWAFEEGVEEGRRKRLLKGQSKRRKRKKISDDSD